MESSQFSALLEFSKCNTNQLTREIGIVGITANWTVVFVQRRVSALQNSFGRLSATQALGDGIHSTIFSVLSMPQCSCCDDIKMLRENSQHIGFALLVCFDISVFSHLFISLNRFCAIFFPIKYEQIFNYFNTTIMIAFTLIVSVVSTFYFYEYEDCSLIHIDQLRLFAFATTPTCVMISWYNAFLKSVSLVIFIVAVDVATVVKVRLTNNQIYSDHKYSSRRRKNDINFLKQACMQAFLFVCDLLCNFIFTPLIPPGWILFFMSMVVWESAHCLDG
ncbi:unnamed protein product [Caenorhabditis auriculariae]|uniref:7TM GPCR serpentine receptor class x (Srx) domain-containing protein n=1 Tax=Caenorhabditis auriculariae TaxID=2777116 RepID=A0A8S1H901_9PELO|nr:unnamed protein product [Caenorhabditis auriculariae]